MEDKMKYKAQLDYFTEMVKYPNISDMTDKFISDNAVLYKHCNPDIDIDTESFEYGAKWVTNTIKHKLEWQPGYIHPETDCTVLAAYGYDYNYNYRVIKYSVKYGWSDDKPDFWKLITPPRSKTVTASITHLDKIEI